MSQIDDDVLWQMKPHTEAKHEILKNYLHRWFPILSTVSGRVVYIDGFAGPGVYSNGEEGSPLIALRAAKDHILKPHFRTEMVFIFIESIKKRARFLKSVLEEKFPELPEKIVYDVISAEFEPTINTLLDGLEKDGSQLAPTFAFIDPFGFTGFPLYLLQRLLKHEKSEVLITFMAGFIKRFTDELREDALDKLFGTEEWRKIRDYEGAKEQPLLELYEKQLKNECDSIEYVKSFEMIGKDNKIIYYMVFGTGHWAGLREMKEAMWSVDKRGTFSFSDRLGRNQTFLTDYQPDEHWVRGAAEKVYDQFQGETVSVEEVEKYVVVETEYVFRKSILRYIEIKTPERINEVVGRKRRGRFPPGCIITFNKLQGLKAFFP